MYIADVPEDLERYQELHVDGKVFYKLKKEGEKANKEPTRKRRYSDQFKDPLFIQKDINRKLKMIKQFREKNGDLETRVREWKDCISECISILQDKYEISPVYIFKSFDLRKHGFDISDYGICEEDLSERNMKDNCYQF